MAGKHKAARLKVSDDTKKMIRGSHPQLKRKLRESLRMIMNDPYCGKALKDELTGLRSFRVGNIRIIFTVAQENIIEIVTIGPRKTIYEETFKLISREKRS